MLFDTRKKIAFIHETKHVGGGQIFANRFYQALSQKKKYRVDLIDNLDMTAWWKIFHGKYQLVVLNVYTPKWVFLSLFLRLFKTKCLLISYGVWALEFRSQQTEWTVRKRARQLYLYIGQNLFFGIADRIVTLSKYHQGLMRKYSPWAANKTTVIYGASEECLRHFSSSEKQANKKQIGIHPSKRMFLLMARLERRKGLDIAIRAFAEAKTKQSVLVIAFPMGPYNNYHYSIELLQLIDELKLSGRVHLCTGISQAERFAFFRAADVFVMSSVTLETFGLTTVEAISQGCVVTGFATGALKEIIPDSKTQFTSTQVSIKSLAKSIAKLDAWSEAKLHDLQKESLKASTSFSWEKSGGKLVREIEELLT